MKIEPISNIPNPNLLTGKERQALTSDACNSQKNKAGVFKDTEAEIKPENFEKLLYDGMAKISKVSEVGKNFNKRA